MKESSLQAIFPGNTWTDGWATPIETPDVPGPFAIPEDECVLEWWLALLIHLYAAVKVCTYGLGDSKPAQMAVAATSEAVDHIAKVYGLTHARNLQLIAMETSRQAWESLPKGAASCNAAEAGWIGHATFCARVIWHTYIQGRGLQARRTERIYRHVEHLFRCAFPDELTKPVLDHFDAYLSAERSA